MSNEPETYPIHEGGEQMDGAAGRNPPIESPRADPSTSLAQALADWTHTYLYGNGRIAQYSGSSPAYFLGDALQT